jgi:glycosyltransferase involved in cell wall biosynthesis
MEPRREGDGADSGPGPDGGGPGAWLFVDNYKDTGIGAFGCTLFGAMREIDARGRLEFTQTTILRGLAQCLRLSRYRGPVVANVGLTSWGRSKVLNLVAFLALGARSLAGRRTVLLLHNVVEVTEEGDTGYRVGYLIRLGASLALRSNARATVVVFSRAIQEVLTEKYEIPDVTFYPLPCPPSCPETPSPGPEARPVVVSLGYLSPYKGIEKLLDAYPDFREVADLLVIGRPHPVLLSDPNYARTIDRLVARMRELGVSYIPFVADDRLCSVLSRCRVGILPYTSTTGTSASFTTLAAAGLPVIATNLREFQELSRDGAGIRLTDGDPRSLARSVRDLLRQPTEIEGLSRSQFAYADAHRLEVTATRVIDRVRG